MMTFLVRFPAEILFVLVLGMLVAASVRPAHAQMPPELDRIPFLIATGPVGGSYMQAGEAIAITVSYPPGLGRCESGGVCGPMGLIATTRSSAGSAANAQAVEARSVQSALVQGDVLLAAVTGAGPFARTGALKDLRVAGRLHDEVLHIVVSPQSGIRRLADLTGKRVAIDAGSADTEFTLRALLGAAGIRFSALKARRMSAGDAAASLGVRKVDAVVMLGVAPIRSLDPLFRRGQARLLSVDSRTLGKLTRRNVFYSKASLPAGAYRSSRQVQALAVASVWVVHRTQDPGVVAQILRAFWAPENRQDIEARGPFAGSLDVQKAASAGRVPLHEGAKRFYGRDVP